LDWHRLPGRRQAQEILEGSSMAAPRTSEVPRDAWIVITPECDTFGTLPTRFKQAILDRQLPPAAQVRAILTSPRCAPTPGIVSVRTPSDACAMLTPPGG
jgi:hypothetical protein